VRVLASFVVLLALSTLISVVVVRQLLMVRTGERVDDSLTQEVEEFRRLARLGVDPRTGRPFGTDVRALLDVSLARNVPGEDQAFFTFLDGRPYRASSSAPVRRRLLARIRQLARTHRPVRGQVETSAGPARYLAAPVLIEGEPRGVFVVSVFLRGERQEVSEAVRVSAGVSLAVLLLAGLLAYLVTGRVLAPLRALTDATRSITESGLSRRIAVRGNDEVAELGRTFNGMLDGLEAAFASQKDFIRDAGHELRTPITIIRGHLELLGDDPQERRETVALVTDELDRMSRFVSDLSLLAKAERPDFLNPETMELEQFTEELLTKARAMADRDWRLTTVGRGRLRADRQRLTQAVMNLVDNAVRVTADRDPIELGSAVVEGEVRMWVRDSGPGVADEDQERIFERYARGRNGRAPSGGSGLGLAIVSGIIAAHEGRVELDSRLGEGATFTCVIPLEPASRVTA